MSTESVMPSHHLILCHPLLLPPSTFPSIRVFSNESVLPIRWPKYWIFSFSINPSNEYSGLISFRIDWLDLLAVQGILKSLLQHYKSEISSNVLEWLKVISLHFCKNFFRRRWKWDLDYRESWASKNWCFWTVVLEKTLESPSTFKEIQLVNHKGNQSWIFIGRTDAEAENPILWPPDSKNWLIWKDPDDGKDWRLEEKEMTEDEMVGWHHRLNGYEFG